MKRFVMAVVVLAVFAGVADAQCSSSRLFSGRLRAALFTPGTASACSASGTCSSATGSCGTAVMTAPVVAAVPVGSVRSTVVHDFLRLKVAAELRKQGKTAGEAKTLADSLTDQIIEGAGSAVGVQAGFFQTLLADLVAFFQSPNGQAILAALVKYLLALLGG